MKIGIYTGESGPLSGGEHTLISTIQDEIEKDTTNKYQYVYLYSGGYQNKYKKVVNGQVYINVDKIINPIFNTVNKILRELNSYPITYKFDKIAERENIDLFWFCAPIHADITYPYIYTVWDLGHRVLPMFPEVSKKYSWQRREIVYQRMLPRASYILTGNETGKKEIVQNYNLDEKKIFVSPFPISKFCFGDEKKPVFDVSDQFFFYPAQFWAHKNHIRIVKAVAILKERYDLKPTFFFTGTDKGNSEYIQSKIDEYQLTDQVKITGFISNEELKYLYTHATAMVFASLMGPNNLPPIEATYLKCPVIITNIEGHREQLGEAAIYFDGYDEEELAEKIKLILEDENLRLELINKGSSLRKKFESVNYYYTVKELIQKFQKQAECWKDC